jgi:hypothetical protein
MSEPPDDDQVLRIMTICDEYATQQKLLGDKLSSGMFQLLQARKNSAVSVDNIRQDFDSCLSLTTDSETGKIELLDDGEANESLLMFSALPPPALRRAQTLFKDSIRIAVELMATIHLLDLESH